MTPPNVVVGSRTWRTDWSPQEHALMVPMMKELGVREMDTAPNYPSDHHGFAEKSIFYHGVKMLVDSKVEQSGDGALTEDVIEKSIDGTLERLQRTKLNVFYCNGPDHTTPLAEQAAAMDSQYRQGKFDKLGLCNFSPQMVQDWIDIATEKGYVKPSVYQGQYNLLCRTYETTLFPLLRKHKMYFVAFGSLAGGFLTGKLTFASSPSDLSGTRFAPENAVGAEYRAWYDKPCMHAAVRKMAELCKKHDVEMRDAAFRWLCYHSQLNGGPILKPETGDGVAIGPMSLEQVKLYADSYGGGPLDDELLEELNKLWDMEGVQEEAERIVAY